MQSYGTKSTTTYWNIFQFTTFLSFHITLMAFLRMKIELKAVNAEEVDDDARVVFRPMKKNAKNPDQLSSIQGIN